STQLSAASAAGNEPAIEARRASDVGKTRKQGSPPEIWSGRWESVHPGKEVEEADVVSGRQTHRGKSQRPRSLGRGGEGNQSLVYRQSHLLDGEQFIGP